MMDSKPLIACTTGTADFRTRIGAVADQLGSDFFASSDLDLTLIASDRRELSCVVVDFESNARWIDHPNLLELGKSRFLLFIVPKGNVSAAFQAASYGAVSVIEKPFANTELALNLKAAIASESQFKGPRYPLNRFSSSAFQELSDREKSVLSLLMDGNPNKSVASSLDIGLRTVEADRAKVIKKMKVPSFVELIKVVHEIENDAVEARKSIFRNCLRENRMFRAS